MITTATHPIAIVGAGIAGLSCAERLQAAGHRVELIEKARAPGGRTSTRRDDDWQCDHGAQYFTAREPAFINAVREWEVAGVVSRWEPRLMAIDEQGMHPAGGGETRYVGYPRMSSLPRYLARQLVVRTGLRVRALGRDGESWLLDTEEAGVLSQHYSAVVVTLPAPQTFELLVVTEPAFADIARNSPMRGCFSLMARYHNDPELPFDAAFVNHGLLSWVARDSSKPGRPIGHTWLLNAPAAEWTAENLNYQPDEVAAAMIDAFTELGAPSPNAWTLHRWLYARNVTANKRASLWDPATRVGVAGDWLLGGRIEGAWLSGHQLAGVMLNQLAPGSSSHPPETHA